MLLRCQCMGGRELNTVVQSTTDAVDVYPIQSNERCTERGCPMPALFLVSDMWGLAPMCKLHMQAVLATSSLEDRSTPFTKTVDSGDKKTGFLTSLDGAQSVDKDWFQTPSMPWERIPSYMFEDVKTLCEKGFPTRQIARIIGYDRRQVRRLIRREFPDVLDLPCPCGLTRRHQGWCRFRFGESEVRQAMMRMMHIKKTASALHRQGASMDEVREKILLMYPAGWPFVKAKLQLPPRAKPKIEPIRAVSNTGNIVAPQPAINAVENPPCREELAVVPDRNWGKRLKRQWRDRTVGVDKVLRAPHDSRGGVNRKRGNL
jgi:hypothetical protein